METSKCKLKQCVCGDGDEWVIDAPDHGNCFWSYFFFNKRQHTLNEIAELTGLSISAVTSIEKKALLKVRKALQQRLEE